MTPTKRAIELRRRSAPVPANRVTVLDPLQPVADEPKAPAAPAPNVYVHIENMHVTTPAPQVVERVITKRPRPRARRRRRRLSPAMRALLMPIVVLLFAIAAVYIAHAVLADPVAFTDHVRTVAR
jgi:hypothetical protein